ncbi:MAG: hypothetical protein IJU64_04775 [Bacilli bacterium]|nr:hypothetical protein [Bacilli bacterium]
MGALKRFGLGLLWIFLLPFILLAIAGVAVWGVLNFLIQFVIMLVNFFRGKKLFPLFPEDQKAMEIQQRAIDKANQATEPAPAPAPQQVFVTQNYYGGGVLPPGTNPGMQNPYGQGLPYQGPMMQQPGMIPPQQPGMIPPQQPGMIPPQPGQSFPYQQPPLPNQPIENEPFPQPKLAELPQYQADAEDDEQ